MEKQYVAPELTEAGDAVKVVLGMSLPGFDFYGWDIDGDMEFQADDPVTAG